MLTEKNKHPHDQYIQFFEVGHRYDITDPITGEMFHPTSTTTLIHRHANEFDAYKIIEKFFIKPPTIDEHYYAMSREEILQSFDKKSDALRLIDKIKNKVYWIDSPYYNKTAEEIKKGWEDNGNFQANLGTRMHYNIECFLNGLEVQDDSKEFGYFLNFWKDFNYKYPQFKPYRLEWLIYDMEKRISGSIDGVLEDDHGNLILLDWKRSKKINFSNTFQKCKGYFSFLDDCNKNLYMLQLNIYRHMLQKNYGKKVVYLMLVILHPNQKNYNCIPIELMDLTEFWATL